MLAKVNAFMVRYERLGKGNKARPWFTYRWARRIQGKFDRKGRQQLAPHPR